MVIQCHFNQIINNNQVDVNHIHGSLLTFGELSEGGEYMSDKFAAICQTTLSFKKHKIHSFEMQ